MTRLFHLATYVDAHYPAGGQYVPCHRDKAHGHTGAPPSRTVTKST